MIALALDGSVFTVALAALLVRIAGLFLLWINLRIKAPWLVLGYQLATFHKIKFLFKPAIAFTAFPLGLALSLQGMVLLIGHLLGASSVVIFTTYRTVTRLLVQFVTMINQALWPEISAAYGAGKINQLIKMYHKGASISFWLAFVSIIVLAFSGDWLIGVWTQHVIQPHHNLLLLLLLVTFINVLWQTSWVVLMATNMHQKISVIFIFSSVAGLLISYFTIPMFGINAAGVALAIVELPLFYLAIKSSLSLLDVSWQTYVKNMLSFPFRK
jgi:O-antigen/teichoic acid export membrane protein